MFRVSLRTRFDKIVAVVAAGLTLLLLSYYAVNVYEFGPRYLVDVLPLYYLLLLASLAEHGVWWRDRALILLSACFNIFLFWTFLTQPLP